MGPYNPGCFHVWLLIVDCPKLIGFHPNSEE